MYRLCVFLVHLCNHQALSDRVMISIILVWDEYIQVNLFLSFAAMAVTYATEESEGKHLLMLTSGGMRYKLDGV